MCIICLRGDNWDIDHIEESIGLAPSREFLFQKSKEIKEKIQQYKVWLASNHLDGFERIAIEKTLNNLLFAQGALRKVI